MNFRVVAIGTNGYSSAPSNVQTITPSDVSPYYLSQLIPITDLQVSWNSDANSDSAILTVTGTYDDSNPDIATFEWKSVQDGVIVNPVPDDAGISWGTEVDDETPFRSCKGDIHRFAAPALLELSLIHI